LRIESDINITLIFVMAINTTCELRSGIEPINPKTNGRGYGCPWMALRREYLYL
jgi:hypothetical protein